jgi:hypothetical protein
MGRNSSCKRMTEWLLLAGRAYGETRAAPTGSSSCSCSCLTEAGSACCCSREQQQQQQDSLPTTLCSAAAQRSLQLPPIVAARALGLGFGPQNQSWHLAPAVVAAAAVEHTPEWHDIPHKATSNLYQHLVFVLVADV